MKAMFALLLTTFAVSSALRIQYVDKDDSKWNDAEIHEEDVKVLSKMDSAFNQTEHGICTFQFGCATMPFHLINMCCKYCPFKYQLLPKCGKIWEKSGKTKKFASFWKNFASSGCSESPIATFTYSGLYKGQTAKKHTCYDAECTGSACATPNVLHHTLKFSCECKNGIQKLRKRHYDAAGCQMGQDLGCALSDNSYNGNQIPATCVSSKFPAGTEFCVDGSTYTVVTSWNTVYYDPPGTRHIGSTVNHQSTQRGIIPKGTKITFGKCAGWDQYFTEAEVTAINSNSGQGCKTQSEIGSPSDILEPVEYNFKLPTCDWTAC